MLAWSTSQSPGRKRLGGFPQRHAECLPAKGHCAPEGFVNRLRNGLKLLVVDDDVDAADSLAALLTLNHYDTRLAYGGEQALDLATTFEPNVVFLDINMPRMDGYATAIAFRQKFPARSPLLIAFTAQPKTIGALAAEHTAFDLHVSKPCDFEYLLHLLDEAISEHLRTGLAE
jgi:CheY-like chemotaxis protein